MDPQSQNSYSYARNNPVTYKDPNGEWWKEWAFGFGPQTTSDFINEVGGATEYMGNTWQTAMDHPYATGAVVGVGGGLLADFATGGYALASAGRLISSALTTCVTMCDKVEKETEKVIEGYNKYSKYWTNTNPNKTLLSSIKYHLEEHGMGMTLKSLTTNAQTVWSKYQSGSSDVVKVVNVTLRNGMNGIRVELGSDAGAIFTETGSIVSSWFGGGL